MNNIVFSNDMETLRGTLSGSKNHYKLTCNFYPYAQHRFLNHLEEEVCVNRIVASLSAEGEGEGEIYFTDFGTAESLIERVGQVFSTYIESEP